MAALTREEWWLHERPRVDMRRSLDGLSRFLATARVAKHRLFAWVDATTLPDSQIIAFARDDDYSSACSTRGRTNSGR
jgi:hypothetical protein